MRPTPTRHLRDCMPKLAVRGPVRRLAIVLGDQLNPDANALKGLDKSRDAILMMEVSEESTHVASHKQRTVLFVSAMRHFVRDLARRGYRVRYTRLEYPENTQSFGGEIERAVRDLKPDHLLCTHPGRFAWRHLRTYRIAQAIPAQPPKVLAPVERSCQVELGVFVCGDHRHLASINGSMASGRKAAEEVLRFLA